MVTKKEISERNFEGNKKGHLFEHDAICCLQHYGFRVIHRNCKGRGYEYDLIAHKNGKYYLVECKDTENPPNLTVIEKLYRNAKNDKRFTGGGIIVSCMEMSDEMKKEAKRRSIICFTEIEQARNYEFLTGGNTISPLDSPPAKDPFRKDRCTE